MIFWISLLFSVHCGSVKYGQNALLLNYTKSIHTLLNFRLPKSLFRKGQPTLNRLLIGHAQLTYLLLNKKNQFVIIANVFFYSDVLYFHRTFVKMENKRTSTTPGFHAFYCIPSLHNISNFSSTFPPHLHLTISKVMVIVWRLRGNIIWTVLYRQRASSSMGTVNRNSSHSPVGLWVCLCVFWVAWFIFMFMCVLFYLGQ